MSEYIPTIGLEIHAELKTKTKMFCNSANDAEEKRPNVNICPVCMAHPGTLPVINKQAVLHVLRVGTALSGTLADFSEFDRKNYFYPDIPKGFQISQYKYPLVSGGKLNGVDITRVHLEEDTAKSFHFNGRSDTFLDFNRAGMPLMELVTEPVIKDSKQAADFAKELQLLLRYLGASEANMDKGQMRVEANISVSKDPNKFGTKVEVKNLNSFKSVARAIDYELKRQAEALDKGEVILQETRGFDENTGKTFAQRLKETSQDYRYFPEPDLPKLKLSEVPEFQNLKATMPELPWEKRKRLSEKFGLREEAVDLFVIDLVMSDFFEAVVKEHLNDKEFVSLTSNYITSDLASLVKAVSDEVELGYEKISIKPHDFEALMVMTQKGDVSSRGAKDILAVMFKEGGEPDIIAEVKGLIQKSNEDELKVMASEIIKENEKVAAEFKAGKEASLQFLVGQAMKKSKGSANPKLVAEVFRELLK
ncbi:MAG: Asp-tRNA(Asn)/Glu-tRNA(Gln) amidotransferase subunit GatB [bacterium]|nr:Asp-tRNA(Asn)/Glu-tRNA(Gln) amidotransferase subunit GatB [bacterium]